MSTFREFCVEQVQRLSIYRRFDFLEQTGQREIRNWLERKGPDSSTVRQQIRALMDSAVALSELPTLADLAGLWQQQNPPVVTVASHCCPHCTGTGWEVVQDRHGNEGVRRCRCGGAPPLPDAAKSFEAPVDFSEVMAMAERDGVR